ncbi:MAG TPA: hypothetical protein VF384_00525 [Planctomycetota bacterium]
MRLVDAERAVLALLAGYASLGVAGTCWLLGHGAVPDWLLPVAAAIGLAVAALHRPPPPLPSATRTWQVLAVVLVVAGLAAILAWGALATPSRYWDGAVAWDLKAVALAADPTLEQPFFRDAAVYSHSRDYPLLQPLALALAARHGLPGRLLFPAAYVAIVIAVAAASRRAGASSGRALLFGLACAVTPMFTAPTSGGFDSGYADGLLAASLAATALGITSRAAILVATGTLVMVMQKPEGLPYAAMLAAALFLRGDTAMLRATTLAGAAGGGLLLALQHDLHTFGHPTRIATTLLAACASAAIVLGLDLALHRLGATWRTRTVVLLAAAPLAVAVLVLSSGGEGIAGTHLANLARACDQLDRLPSVVYSMLDCAWFRGRYGLTFVAPLAIAYALRGRRDTAAPALLCWILMAVPLWCAPFLLAPIEPIEHHLRSTMPRLLLHWCGVVWIWSAVQLRPSAAPEAIAPRAASPAASIANSVHDARA